MRLPCSRLVERDAERGLEVIHCLHAREELPSDGGGDVLTRLFRRVTTNAIPLLHDMMADEDESVLAAAPPCATACGSRPLGGDHDEGLGPSVPVVRRNVVMGLRDYIQRTAEDEVGLLPKLGRTAMKCADALA